MEMHIRAYETLHDALSNYDFCKVNLENAALTKDDELIKAADAAERSAHSDLVTSATLLLPGVDLTGADFVEEIRKTLQSARRIDHGVRRAE